MCVPLEYAVEIGAKVVVEEELYDLVGVEMSAGMHIVIEVLHTEWERLQAQRGPQLPAVGPSDSTVLAPIAWTSGLGVYLRPGPARMGTVSNGVPEGGVVSILCTARGEVVDGPSGPSDLWDRVAFEGQVAYVSDTHVNTGTNQPVAPSC